MCPNIFEYFEEIIFFTAFKGKLLQKTVFKCGTGTGPKTHKN
jgi:hypothetical protein